MSLLFGNSTAGVWRNAAPLVLFLLFPSALLFAQATKKPNEYALTAQEQVIAQAVCISQKYGPGGEAAWLVCQDEVMNGMRASKKLRYFEGRWRLRADLKASPWSRAGKFSRIERNEWLEQNWSLVSHWAERLPAGARDLTVTYKYDLKRKLYTSRECDSAGAAEGAVGTLDKGTWTWKGTTQLRNGKAAKDRWIFRPISSASYRFQLEIALPSGAWLTVLEGTATKLP